MIREQITSSEEETFRIGLEIGKQAHPGDVIALSGELGSGKTVLAKGIAGGLEVTDDITSPTFTLLEIYDGRLPFYHFDLYRIESGEEMDQLFFEEYWEGSGVSVIEWAERAGGRLPDKIIRITLSYQGTHQRRITLEYPDS